MATSCPCGCGRRVGFSVKGSAVGAQNMDVMLSQVAPVIESALAEGTLSAAEAEQFRSFLANGHRIQGWFLDHVHKHARPGLTPDVLNLKRMMDEWAQAALALAAA